MQIDFSSLSFKIEKVRSSTPSNLEHAKHQSQTQPGSYKEFSDGKLGSQQQTVNPFRRTFHLFKHVEVEKRSSREKSHRMDKVAQLTNTTQMTYSLQNFDSFKNFDSKADRNYFRELRIEAIPQQNPCDYIKIQSNFQYSDDLSLIVDDLNTQIRCEDLAWDNHRRVKTELSNFQSKLKVKQKKSEGIFCLTAQDENSESTVQQFYFNLKEEQEKIKNHRAQGKEFLKKEIKEILHDFVESLQYVEPDEIDPNFLERIQNCLVTVKKIPVLPSPAFKSPEKTQKKINDRSCGQSNKKYRDGGCERKRQIPRVGPNKQNWMQSKNLGQKSLDQKWRKDNMKKRWM